MMRTKLCRMVWDYGADEIAGRRDFGMSMF